jgi:hypothetical protein
MTTPISTSIRAQLVKGALEGFIGMNLIFNEDMELQCADKN